MSPEDFARGQVPNLADVDRDGYLDLFVTRNASIAGGIQRPGQVQYGNSFYVSDGAWDRLRDVSESMGIRNELAYNRQPAFGDVDQDGWLDIAVGADNIKNANGGFPHSRLYVYNADRGVYEDAGGTPAVPDFGGFYADPDKDRASPDINLVDLDNDGDLDLLQACHVDVQDLEAKYSPIEYRQGIFCWKNLTKETGGLQFEKVTDNGLAAEGRLRYDKRTKKTIPEGRAPGLPYVAFADTDNDGDLDILAVGPGTPGPAGFAPRTEYAGGRFWRNLGDFQFKDATDEVGLTPVTWTYGKWSELFNYLVPRRPQAPIQPKDRYPYYSDAVFGDFNNDGWQDLVVLDRSGSALIPVRAALFMNKGDGTFVVQPTSYSGLDAGGISAEAADLNNDGLLDLVFASDPDNTGVASSMSGYESRIYWNTGLHGAGQNNWIRFRFGGVDDASLIGSRVQVIADDKSQYRWIHSNHAYKSGSPLEAHFGLADKKSVKVVIRLLNGQAVEFNDVSANHYYELRLDSGIATVIDAK